LIELVTKYLLFIIIPIFTHFFYSVKNKRFWNWLFVIIAIIFFSLNHFTLYILPESNIRNNINLFLNILLFFIFVYPIIIGIFYHKKLADLELKKFSVRFLIIFGSFTPGFFIDVFFCHLAYNLSIPGFSTFFYITLGLLFVIFVAKNYYFININKDQIALFFKKYNISEREGEIINLVLKGYSYNQIADLLFISLNTVRAHIRSIYPKIGINSRYELMCLIRSL
jgi:DNA-binding CsgD family transcriptional regulator